MTVLLQTVFGIALAGGIVVVGIAAIQMVLEDVQRGRQNAARAERLRAAARFYDHSENGRL